MQQAVDKQRTDADTPFVCGVEYPGGRDYTYRLPPRSGSAGLITYRTPPDPCAPTRLRAGTRATHRELGPWSSPVGLAGAGTLRRSNRLGAGRSSRPRRAGRRLFATYSWKALLYTPRTIVIGCAVTPPPIILVASRERAAQPQPGRAASEGRAYGIGVARTDTIFVKSRLNALGAKPSGNHSVDRLLLHLGGCQHVRLQPERCCAALECHVARVDAIHG